MTEENTGAGILEDAGSTNESLFPDGAEARPAEVQKRRRGRPRKTPAADSAESVGAGSSVGADFSVPMDRPVEWIVPKSTDAEGVPVEMKPRASSVLPPDELTIRHAADVLDIEEKSAEEKSQPLDSGKSAGAGGDAASGGSDGAAEPQDEAFLRQRYPQQGKWQGRFQQPRRPERRELAPDGDRAEQGPEQPEQHEDSRQNQQDRRFQRFDPRRQQSNNARWRQQRPGARPQRDDQAFVHDGEDSAPQDVPPPLNVRDLQRLDTPELVAMAEERGIADELSSLWKHDIIYAILRNHSRAGGQVIAEGVLEVVQDGSGFLRNEWNSFKTCPEDAAVPQQLVRKFALRPGDVVRGITRPPTREQKDRRYGVVFVESVNGMPPNDARRVRSFESLVPTFPTRRINLETTPDQVEMRITNLFTPIGFGQRGLIVAPPRTGKTVLMQKMANAISENHPDAELIILLIDERPEEVTDMQRNTKAKVFSSTFDEPPECHVQVAGVVIEYARRLVEQGRDVIILLDSITRLARAHNTVQPHSGKILTGGVDANALQKPKRFFGSARNIEGGGSLTIIGTALVDTGSKMDEVIFEEFKGTGNMELCLDRQLSDKRMFPAVNINSSGTRKENELLHPDELKILWDFRSCIANLSAEAVMSVILSVMRSTKTNVEFLLRLRQETRQRD